MSEAAQTANAAQARLLLDPALGPLLGALAKAPPEGLGAADLARRAGAPLSTTHARLERLRAAWVVEVAGERTRSGRPVRLYRLPLPWHIPFEVTPAATLRELLGGGFEERLRGHLDSLAGRMQTLGAGWYVALYTQPDGLFVHAFRHQERTEEQTQGPLDEPLLAEGHDLRLSPRRAQDLQQKLWTLLREYADAQDEGDVPTWRVTLLLTPEVRERE